MSISTSEFWSVDGVPLQTMAYNISTMGGDRMAPRPLRGGDYVVPHRHGEVWQPKTVDSMVITLGMWVIGADEDGNIPAGELPSRQFQKNFKMLRRLLWTPGRQVKLEKKFFDDDGILRTVSVMAEYASGLSPIMNGRARASFTVDLKLAYPYFTPDTWKTVALTAGDNTIVVAGDAPTRNLEFVFGGTRGRTTIQNKTLGHSFQIQNITAAQRLELGVHEFNARLFTGSTSVSAVSMVTHLRNPYWLELTNGTNIINVSTLSGTGTMTLRYKEVWL